MHRAATQLFALYAGDVRGHRLPVLQLGYREILALVWAIQRAHAIGTSCVEGELEQRDDKLRAGVKTCCTHRHDADKQLGPPDPPLLTCRHAPSLSSAQLLSPSTAMAPEPPARGRAPIIARLLQSMEERGASFDMVA